MKGCTIVGAGEFFETSLSISEDDFVIAADGGFAYLSKLGVTPDLLVADFDSLSFVPDRIETIKLSEEKDDTDMAKAVKIALEKGCGVFNIYGGTGGRLDHTLANIQLLFFLSKKGLKGYLYGKDVVLTAVTNGDVNFDASKTGFVSVFAAGEKAENVTLKGLKYPLQNHCLTNDFPLGVSNEFTGVESRVSVGNGTLLVVSKR